jgi:phosphohistidine phosphatase
MLRLILLRHAKSDWSRPGTSDHQRPLNRRGRIAAPRIGTYMAEERLLPQLVLVSTALRTRETWQLVSQNLRARVRASFDERLYESTPATILSVIRETPAPITTLMIVGHNPGLHAVALALTGSGDRGARSQLAEKFPTCALAVLDFAADRWTTLAPGGGRLERFVTPRALSAGDD